VVKPRAVVLLSGGLDSCTAAAWAKREGFEVCALSFDYGQRHRKELAAARKVAASLSVKAHKTLKVPIGELGGSALTDKAIAVPDAPKKSKIGAAIPVTYVPARNTIFLSYALALAEVAEARDIFIGVNALDYSGYPDCRPEFIGAFQRLANLATRAGVENTEEPAIRIRTPLIDLSKKQIIELGIELGVDYSMTTSCYDPTADGEACGRCDACQLRLRGFREAGVNDPGRYAAIAQTPAASETR